MHATVRDLLPNQNIVSETCKAAKISVKWLLTKDDDHPQKQYHRTNALAADFYIFHKNKNQSRNCNCGSQGSMVTNSNMDL